MKRTMMTLGLVCFGSLSLTGCGLTGNSNPQIVQVPGDTTQVYIQEPVRTAPGVVEYVWEEPMTDVIEIPPGLDPDGVYYRPAHQSIVEIRQGRWKYHKSKR